MNSVENLIAAAFACGVLLCGCGKYGPPLRADGVAAAPDAARAADTSAGSGAARSEDSAAADGSGEPCPDPDDNEEARSE